NHALGLDLKPGELSEFARRGSGSAARSIFGGYVEMAHGDKQDGSDAVATPLLDSGEWPLSVLVAITSTAKKAIASTEGMENTSVTSPYYPAWVDTSGADLEVARRAIADKDFDKLADVSEFSCLKMHGSALAAQPGLLYWNGATVDCLNAVRAMRANGVPVFFTVDAGPQVKAVCEPAYRDRVADSLRAVSGVQDVLATELGEGARLIGDSQ
ncbi:MAG: diphosphomevalonate decarboxylase, partial [Gammaproteobacteria bacterium]|nr:diphosphomevalonate decarboxylase [Gammaproteobacteria bacterium]